MMNIKALITGSGFIVLILAWIQFEINEIAINSR